MKNIIGTIFFSGVLFFGASIPTALAGENNQETLNGGFGAYFVDAGHPGFVDHEQSPLLAFDSFTPSDLDNIEPAGGAETGTNVPLSTKTPNEETYGPVIE